jgi:tetratricopeptide (TPR) repeat protein
MANLAELLQSALQLHRGGQFERARMIYEEILQHDPRHADALNLRGLVAWQTGQFAEAVGFLRQAIALDSSQAAYFANLGESYRGLGQVAEAIEAYTEAVRLQPTASLAHLNLGILLQEFGSPVKAIASYERAVQQDPQNEEAHYRLGSVLHQQGQLHSAGVHYEKTLERNPDHFGALINLAGVRRVEGQLADATALCERALRLEQQMPPETCDVGNLHTNLGNLYQLQGRMSESIACYRRALGSRPDDVEALCNLGNALREQQQLDEALSCLQRAMELQPDAPATINNLGALYHDLGRLSEAQRFFERAVELEPRNAKFHANLGTVLLDQHCAIECYERALRLQPDDSQALCSRGMSWLSLGNFLPGWAGYEHRVDCPQFNTARFPQPLWDGSPLGGRTLLIHGEQGLGDTLQFIRYVNRVESHGGKVIIGVQAALVPLLAQSGFTGLLPKELPLPPFDVHAPLMSLPHIFQTDIETVPCDIPYLCAEPALVETWRGELDPYDGLKVGIAWQGRANYRFDRLRSIPLEEFAPLARPGVRLLSLQKGPGAEQLAALEGRFDIVDWGRRIDNTGGAFLDTAAVMKNLDLVITSDTSIAHLAGALGVPVWVALSAMADWRWIIDRDDSPWYPTMRLFRQSQLDQWPEVFQRMAAALAELEHAD